ncbi:MAG: insulinase family protein [bacterium]|nr:insulinase family protein [bacterium]
MRLFLIGILMLSAMTAAFAQTPGDNSAEATKAPAVIRTSAPSPGAPPSLTIPAIEKRVLSNGIPVWLAKRSKAPMVSVRLTTFGGASNDPAGKYGVANAVAYLLGEGTETYSSLEFADAVDALGAFLWHDADYDSCSVDLIVMKDYADKALHLMADSVLHPAFDEKELVRYRKKAEDRFRRMRQSPDLIAYVAMKNIIYGDSRYGADLYGPVKQMFSITRDDIVAYYHDNFYPDNTAIIVTGDIEPDNIMAMLEKEFGSWKNDHAADKKEASSSENSKLNAPLAISSDGNTVLLVNRPGASQSVIYTGCEGVARNTPDYFQLEAANAVLGGSYMSRINQNLRERNGYTYGAYSMFDMMRKAGSFMVITSVQSDKTAPAVKEIMNELESIVQPIPEPELKRACSYMAYSLPGDFETSRQLLFKISDIQLYGLKDDFYNTYVQNLMSLDPKDVARAVNLVIDPHRCAIVIVGDAESVVPQLESCGLKVKVISIDDVVGEIPSIK